MTALLKTLGGIPPSGCLVLSETVTIPESSRFGMRLDIRACERRAARNHVGADLKRQTRFMHTADRDPIDRNAASPSRRERADTRAPEPLPTLVIVSGAPGTGKSTLTRHLRECLGWPVLNLDHFKETLFDASGMRVEELTRSVSRQLGAMAEAAMLEAASELLQSRVSCIVESFFWPEPAQRLRPIAALGHARQIHCVTPAAVSIARYRERFERGERHPVHLDWQEAEHRATEPLPDEALQPVPLGVPVLTVRTEAGYVPSLDAIVHFCTAEFG